MTRNNLTLFALVCALLVAPLAGAQQGSMQGEDNEFGSIRTPYAADMDGERVPVQAEITISDYYHEKDGRFYMFAFDVQHMPLDVQLTQIVREDTGQDIPCFKTEGDSKSQIKCFVDGRTLPPVGTKIIMYGSVGASKLGTYTVGAIVVAFTATWLKIQMSNGLDAELYAGTQVNVHGATEGGANKLGGIGNKIPGVGTVGVVAAVGLVAVGLAAMRRRS